PRLATVTFTSDHRLLVRHVDEVSERGHVILVALHQSESLSWGDEFLGPEPLVLLQLLGCLVLPLARRSVGNQLISGHCATTVETALSLGLQVVSDLGQPLNLGE